MNERKEINYPLDGQIPSSNRPDPEKTAMDWTFKELDLTNTRINYWILTEGILLSAFVAATSQSLATIQWHTRVVICIGGILISFVWYFLCIRSWYWFNLNLNRLQAIHKYRYGVPMNMDQPPPPWGVFGDSLQDSFAIFEGKGLSGESGIKAILIVFLTIWLILLSFLIIPL